MQKPWGELSDEKISLIVRALATPKDWTSLWNAVKERISSRTTLNIYLQHLQERKAVIRSVDEKRRVTYRLADPRQEALAAKLIHGPQIPEALGHQIIEAFAKLDKQLLKGDENYVSITDEAVTQFKKGPLAKSMKPTIRWAKWQVYHEALTIAYFYYMLLELYLDAITVNDKEIANIQWNEEFVTIIFEIRKRFYHLFGLPIRAGLLKEEHVREAIHEWLNKYRTRSKYGEAFRSRLMLLKALQSAGIQCLTEYPIPLTERHDDKPAT